MKKTIFLFLAMLFVSISTLPIYAENARKSEAEYWDMYIPSTSIDLDLDVKSAILVESNTGTVLYEHNAREPLAPASVTKTMTLLLVAESVASGQTSPTDEVMISEYAASMGGSQVFLKEGECMSVEDLIKCTVIASANDAAVALAEHISGNEKSFVTAMNERARSLGLQGSVFENTTGLDDDVTEHTMSASDIAVISRELLKHDIITKYSSVWQDSIRNGEFTLTNTNRLVRYYEGCTGLKTGSTDKAGFCVSASAKRGNTELIAVIMGAETGSGRNEAARGLLDFGFSNYALYKNAPHDAGRIKTAGATVTDAPIVAPDTFFAVVNKSDLNKVTVSYELPDKICAPLSSGTSVGRVIYKIGDKIIGSSVVILKEDLKKISFINVFFNTLFSSFAK